MPVAMIMTCHDSQKQLVATGVMILIDSRSMNRQKYEKASNKLDRQSETLASAMQFQLWTCGLPQMYTDHAHPPMLLKRTSHTQRQEYKDCLCPHVPY